MNQEARKLIERATRLPPGAVRPELRRLLEKLALFPIATGLEYVTHELDLLEARLSVSESPFFTPDSSAVQGDIEIGTTSDGEAVRITLGQGNCDVVHFAIIGPSGSGKSMVAAAICSQAKSHANVVIFEYTGSLSRVKYIRDHFDLACLRHHLRRNPFDPLPNANVSRWEQIERVLQTHSDAYKVEWGRRVGLQIAEELDAKGPLTFHALHHELSKLRFRPNSNMVRYAESSLLAIDYCINGNSPSLDCLSGHDLQKVLTRGAIVLSTAALSLEHAAWRTAELLDSCEMTNRGKRVNRQLLLVIDDCHSLLNHEISRLDERLLTLRHSGISCCLCIQSVSLLPRHVFANLSGLIVFPGIVDQRDRLYLAQSLNLTQTQAAWLATSQSSSQQRQALCFLPRQFPSAFIIRIPHLDFAHDSQPVPSPAFLSALAWTPLNETCTEREPKDINIKPFLLDVYANRFDTLSKRFMRLGTGSTSQQQEILKKLQEQKLIKIWHVVDVNGRLALVELLPRACELIDRPAKKIRGVGAGIAHEYYALGLKRRYDALQNYKTRLEENINGHIADLVAEDYQGLLLTHDIKVTTSVEHELAAVVRLFAGITHIEKHFIVCGTKEETTKTRKLVEKHLAGSLFDKRIDPEKICVIQFAKLGQQLEQQASGVEA